MVSRLPRLLWFSVNHYPWGMEAPEHPQEQERLEALHTLDLLDTEAEQAYDELVQLASKIANTPIALISLVDRHRQWFKARVGLDPQETPRELAFCAHAILTPDEHFVVPDASRDPRFKGNPLVTGDPNIRFYAGFPIRAGKLNQPVGTLCVIDHHVQELDAETEASLHILARQVEHLFQIRQTLAELRSTHSLLEDQLKVNTQQSKLATIGELAAGIGHEINNPLAVIMASLDFLGSKLQNGGIDTELGRKLIANQQDAAQRIKHITMGLRNFARSNDTEPEVYDAIVTVRDAVNFVRELYNKEGVKVRLNAPDEPLETYGLPANLQQVVINLMSNAKYALRSSPRSEKAIQLEISSQKDWVRIDVIDNGGGIPEEIQGEVFKNFFSTKRKHEGSGLGLAISRKLCETAGGSLSLSSEPGHTVFRIHLPRYFSGEACSQGVWGDGV